MYPVCFITEGNVGTYIFQGCIIAVNNVQSTQGYVVHMGTVEEGEITTGDTVQLLVNQVRVSVINR